MGQNGSSVTHLHVRVPRNRSTIWNAFVTTLSCQKASLEHGCMTVSVYEQEHRNIGSYIIEVPANLTEWRIRRGLSSGKLAELSGRSTPSAP